jgi:hypothetical protein
MLGRDMWLHWGNLNVRMIMNTCQGLRMTCRVPREDGECRKKGPGEMGLALQLEYKVRALLSLLFLL